MSALCKEKIRGKKNYGKVTGSLRFEGAKRGGFV